MAALNLTVLVLNLSPRVTPGQLSIFFSYCGSVQKIQLQRNKDRSQSALVTFNQPYAYQTSLLLNDAIFAELPIRILPSKDLTSHPDPDKLTNGTKNHETQGFVPAVQNTASRGVENFNRTRGDIEEKGITPVVRTKSAVSAAEQAAGHIATKIMNNEYISTGTAWLSGAIEKVSKCVSQLGSAKKKNLNSGKQK